MSNTHAQSGFDRMLDNAEKFPHLPMESVEYRGFRITPIRDNNYTFVTVYRTFFCHVSGEGGYNYSDGKAKTPEQAINYAKRQIDGMTRTTGNAYMTEDRRRELQRAEWDKQNDGERFE